MFDLADVLAGAILALITASLLPNRVLNWTWRPKTKWGKRRVRKRIERL